MIVKLGIFGYVFLPFFEMPLRNIKSHVFLDFQKKT